MLKCDVIVTGSNLASTKEFFQPAGDLTYLRMYPISFEEFVNYFGGYQYYKNTSMEEICKEKYEWFSQAYKTYLRVGGYPSVVEAFLQKRPLLKEFEKIISAFKSEFRANTGNPADYDKIEVMFQVICDVLCREKRGNPRIVSMVSEITAQNESKRINKAECNNILAWMSAARIINYCDKIDLRTDEVYFSERFYLEDVGLFHYLCSKYHLYKSAVMGISNEMFVFKQLSEGKLDYAVYARGEGMCGREDNVITVPIFLLNRFDFSLGGAIEPEELPELSAFC